MHAYIYIYICVHARVCVYLFSYFNFKSYKGEKNHFSERIVNKLISWLKKLYIYIYIYICIYIYIYICVCVCVCVCVCDFLEINLYLIL